MSWIRKGSLDGIFCPKLKEAEWTKYLSTPEAYGIALKLRDNVDSGHRVL
jgi:hypothetical protein